MNYTENYHLPQWEENDRIMRTDFNQMCADIESGMTENADAAAAAQTAADAAQSTADTARSEAAVLPYVTGAYTGNGEVIRDINVGFRPSFVLICKNQHSSSSQYCEGATMAGPDVSSTHIFLTDSGFRLDLTESRTSYPRVNENGTIYNYLAFR